MCEERFLRGGKTKQNKNLLATCPKDPSQAAWPLKLGLDSDNAPAFSQECALICVCVVALFTAIEALHF